MKTIARDHEEGKTQGKIIYQHNKAFSMGLETKGSFIAKPEDLKMWISAGTQEYEELTFSFGR